MSDYRTIIAPADLAACLEADNWRIFDCRHDLARPEAGEAAFAAGHLPGAQFLHLDRDLSSPMTGTNGRHPLPDPERLAIRLAECGVDNDSQVVAYDDLGGVFASRLWWLLKWLGHDRVAVLDGGVQAWRAAGLPFARSVRRDAPSRFGYTVRDLAVDARYVTAHLETSDMLLIDARSADRFRGENETLDPVGGHIPGSINRFYKLNLERTGNFKSAQVLREEYLALLGRARPSDVVHSCGSGVSACHNALAMEIAGLPCGRLYGGSWSEWCSDPSRPVAR